MIVGRPAYLNKAGVLLHVGVTLTAFLLTLASTSLAEAGVDPSAIFPERTKNVWQDGGDSIWVVPCSLAGAADNASVAVEARRQNHAARSRNCYRSSKFVSVIWSGEPGMGGPDAIALGAGGGSAACGDVISITFAPRPKMQTLGFCEAEQIPILLLRGIPEFAAPLDVSSFNGANGADTRVGDIIVSAQRYGFVADIPSMIATPLTVEEYQRTRSTVVADLHRWAMSLGGGAVGLSTPDTLEAMLNLILSGRADQARMLLFDAGWTGVGRGFKVRVSVLIKRVWVPRHGRREEAR